MEIVKLIPCGYCKGVVNAINLAKQTRIDNPKANIYILGMLVHNDHVSKQLEKLNIITLDDANISKEEQIEKISSGIIIFTAHGIAESIKQKVIDKGLSYVDASCEVVLKSHDIIKEYLDKGYDVIYFGKKNHPEAQATQAISKHIHLVCNQKDIENLNTNNPLLFMTNQTTMSTLELAKYQKQVQNKYPKVIISNEICNATSLRQKAILSIQDGDLLYVVGSAKSNNTNKLVEIALTTNIKKVRLIDNYQQIELDDLKDVNKIYVTAGASTPPILINEVINYLDALA